MGDTEGGGRMEYKHLTCAPVDTGISIVLLRRPEVLNSFNKEMMQEFRSCLEGFCTGDSEKVLIISGAGQAFCAGEDLDNVGLDADKEAIEKYASDALENYQGVVLTILSSPKPIIAALNGSAIGAGLSIALACDERFAVAEDHNYLMPAFSRIGLVPDSGIVATLERLVGLYSTKEALGPKGRISFSDALMQGIVRETFSDYSQMMTAAAKFARDLMSERSLEEYGMTKAMLNMRLINELQTHIFPAEKECQRLLLQSEYFKERVREFRAKKAAKEAK